MEVAVAHQPDDDVGGVAAVRHGDVEMLDAACDVGDDFGELRLAVGAVDAVGEHAHRPVVFADAVDPAGEMVFGAEGGLEEAVEISLSVKVVFSARWREATPGTSAARNARRASDAQQCHCDHGSGDKPERRRLKASRPSSA